MAWGQRGHREMFGDGHWEESVLFLGRRWGVMTKGVMMHRVRVGLALFWAGSRFLGDNARRMMPPFWGGWQAGHNVPLLPCCIPARGQVNWQSAGGFLMH